MTTQDNPFAFNADPDKTQVATSEEAPADLSQVVPPQALHSFARFSLILFCLVSVLSMGSSLMQVSLLDEVRTGIGPDFDARATANDNRELGVTVLNLLILIVAGIVSLKLLHRLRSNVDHLGARELESTPGWSVGWFFVPIANLWKPLGATRQTWQASISPESWQSVKAPGILGVWWFFWIVASVVGRVSSRFETIAGEGIDALVSGTWIAFGHSMLTMIAALCYMSVLKQMTETQVETFHKLSQSQTSRF